MCGKEMGMVVMQKGKGSSGYVEGEGEWWICRKGRWVGDTWKGGY